MKQFKKVVSVAASLALLATSASLVGCSDKKVIGIMQFGTHESLNNCYDGILKGLKENGIDVENGNYEIKYLNDNFQMDTAASHAKTLVNSGADLIVGIATPSAIQAAEASNGEIPVVYCAITDDAVMKAYQNVCGSSDRPNYTKTLELVTSVMGRSDLNIGVISATSESSDAVMIEDLTKASKAYNGMEISVSYVTEISTITTVTDRMINDGVDCFLNLLDNTVVGELDNILAVTNEAKIPVFGSEVEQVVKGCVAASSIDYIEIGRIAGEMSAKILNGTSTAAKLGGKIISDPTPYYNPDVIAKLGLTVPTISGVISIKDYVK